MQVQLISNELLSQQIIINQMLALRCEIPDKPPSNFTYQQSAIACATSNGQNTRLICDRNNWNIDKQ